MTSGPAAWKSWANTTIEHRYLSIEELLADARWDAVHLVTPVSTHADFAVKVLNAGKHCACAVPMARTEADIHRVLEAERSSRKKLHDDGDDGVLP